MSVEHVEMEVSWVEEARIRRILDAVEDAACCHSDVKGYL